MNEFGPVDRAKIGARSRPLGQDHAIGWQHHQLLTGRILGGQIQFTERIRLSCADTQRIEHCIARVPADLRRSGRAADCIPVESHLVCLLWF